jgi:hypothetical protein
MKRVDVETKASVATEPQHWLTGWGDINGRPHASAQEDSQKTPETSLLHQHSKTQPAGENSGVGVGFDSGCGSDVDAP